MITLLLQNVLALTLVYFAVVAILAGRATPAAAGEHRAAWIGTGVIFLAYGLNMIVQAAWGTTAFFAGASAAVYRGYVEVAPVFNHSRTFLLFVLYAMLAFVALRGSRKGSLVLLFLAIATALALGGAYGLMEGRIQAARHFSSTAVIDTGGFILLGGVLLLLLVRNAVDRLLWFALALQGVFSILGVVFLTAMAWADTAYSWTPPFWSLTLVRCILALGMAALATRRLSDARRGIRSSGLLEPLKSGERISIGT